MARPTEALKMSLSYLKNIQVKEAFIDLLDRLNSDLDEAGYEPSSEMEGKITDLEDAVNDYEDQQEELDEEEEIETESDLEEAAEQQ